MKLPIRQVEKPWGRDTLPAPFPTPDGRRIGEIWFEPPHELPDLLVKYLFTSDKLSVQVHPSDAQAIAAGLGRQGKEECWLVIAAEPGATLGIGFHQPLDADTMRAAALDGSIEQLMQWYSVRPGDFFYIPAGTVHAIGAGVSLIEVQQNSDITYRLYDYGRPRALHLDQGIAVARGAVYPHHHRAHVAAHASATLVDGPPFRLDQLVGEPPADLRARYQGPFLAIPREGPVRIADSEIPPGGCGVARGWHDISFAASGVCLLAQSCRDQTDGRPGFARHERM